MGQKQFEEIASCVGKTIKEVHAGSYADYLIILFEDNTYTFIEPSQVYEDFILQTRSLDIVECADKDLIELGIYSQEEVDEHLKQINKDLTESIKDRELQMLAYLNEKYKKPETKYLRCGNCTSRDLVVVCNCFNSDRSPSEDSEGKCNDCGRSGSLSMFFYWCEEGEN